MLVNQIINIEEDFDSGGVTEPVTLLQVKEYLRLNGFGSEDSGEQEFDYDDVLIESMITEARMWVEKYTGRFIVPRSLTVVLLNQAGYIRLPGPVAGTLVIKDDNGDTIVAEDYEVIGASFPKIETKFSNRISATYDVGYSTFPKWAENSIMAYIADHYEYRGDDLPPAPNERAAQIARPYREVQSWG